MVFSSTLLTDDLRDWLGRSHDAGQALLQVVQRGEDLEVTRADGNELSVDEQSEVMCRLAMQAMEPTRPPTRREWLDDGAPPTKRMGTWDEEPQEP